MTPDEIEALAKRLETKDFEAWYGWGGDLGPMVRDQDNIQSAAALRHLMARVSEVEKERDAALSALEAAGWKGPETKNPA